MDNNTEIIGSIAEIVACEPAKPFVDDDGIYVPSDVDFRYHKLLISKELFVEAYYKWIVDERKSLTDLHAKWELADDGDGVVCSHCGTDFCILIYYTDEFLYCPHCGAKMDLEKKDE